MRDFQSIRTWDRSGLLIVCKYNGTTEGITHSEIGIIFLRSLQEYMGCVRGVAWQAMTTNKRKHN